MDDNVSIKSSDSLTTSGEYEIVPETPMDTQKDSKSPTLNIANNGDFLALKKDMTEVIKELDKQKTDSINTDGDYEMIQNNLKTDDVGPSHCVKTPVLQLGFNHRTLSDMEKELAEAIREDEKEESLERKDNRSKVCKSATNNKSQSSNFTLPIPSTSSSITVPSLTTPASPSVASSITTTDKASTTTQSDLLSPKSDLSTPDINRVGHSIFYDCLDLSPAGGYLPDGGEGAGGSMASERVDEKQDDMKPEKNSDTEEEISDIDQGCTIFSGVTYLGSTNINSPKFEPEIQRTMCELNRSSNSAGLRISVSIPTSSEGLVMLYDADTGSIVKTYEIQRILFYAHGAQNSNEQACFAFTWSHGDSQESTVFQCHIFRCDIPEAVTQVSSCFVKAFQRYPPSLTGSITSAVDNSIMLGSVTSDLSGNPINSADYEFVVSLEIRERDARSTYVAVPRDRSYFKLRCNTDKEVCITVVQTASKVYQPLYIDRCFGVLITPGKLLRQADMQLLDMVSMGYQKIDVPTLACLAPYQIRAEWKANDKAFEQLNNESQKMFLTVAVDLVIKGIQEPVRFIIETPVTIQSQGRIMDHFISKRPMTLKFYLQLKKTDEDNWEVSSVNPSEEIIEQQSNMPTSASILKLGINNLSKMVRSSSAVSIEQDTCPTEDYSSDGDEPLLSGTGEVPKECSQDIIEEWCPILKDWDSEKRPKGLSSLVRIGIPEALRGKIWQKLANVETRLDMAEKYRILITKETKCETVIQRDIYRTFPAHDDFKEMGGSGQDALFKVSKAYAVYDSEVGYCQGLSFIAASLLLHMPEEDAFCVLVALMYDYGLRDLYKHGFEALYMRLFQLNRLIRDHLPKLHEHFERCGIETHMFASQWFLTLFTARFPLCFVFHVLDIFLLDGMQILFQVAISLLTTCETDLMKLDFEGILKYFRVSLPKKCRNSSQAQRIIQKACDTKVKKLKQYEEEFHLYKKDQERKIREEKEAQMYAARFSEERKKYQSEILILQQDVGKAKELAIQEERKRISIVQDYKQIIQRQEQQITKLNEILEDITGTVSKCEICSSNITPNSPLHKTFGRGRGSLQNNNKTSSDAPLGPLDPLNVALQRIRELELELAQTKLAQVEAECKNQDLNHQLNTTLTEIQSNRGSWQPWLSKTINTIQEKVTTRKDQPTFHSYLNQETSSQERQNKEEIVENRSNKNRPIRTRNNSMEVFTKNENSPTLREAINFANAK